MKVITKKELFQIKGNVVWGYYDPIGFDFPDSVYIQYNGDIQGEIKRACYEEFPITSPDYGYECLDHGSTIDKFKNVNEGVVKDIDTTSDLYIEEDSKIKVIIYDQRDINKWVDKLKSLNITY